LLIPYSGAARDNMRNKRPAWNKDSLELLYGYGNVRSITWGEEWANQLDLSAPW
jgi:hypothetical protein